MVSPNYSSRSRQLWRYVRRLQPFNRIAAVCLRSGLRLGLPLEVAADHLPVLGTVTLDLPNGKSLALQSHGDDYIVNQIYWKNVYEPETAKVFFELAAKSSCTIDVGAHVGVYAAMAGLANPAGRVFAFEPLPSAFSRLQETIRLNKLSNVFASSDALGNMAGQGTIFHVDAPGVPSNSTLRKATTTQWKDAALATAVPVTTIDAFASKMKLAKVDFVKMDTEGTEPDVIRGMKEVLARDRPDILCEVLKGIGSPAELEPLLEPFGYRYYRLEPSGAVRSAHIEPHDLWWNHLFSQRGF